MRARRLTGAVFVALLDRRIGIGIGIVICIRIKNGSVQFAVQRVALGQEGGVCARRRVLERADTKRRHKEGEPKRELWR